MILEELADVVSIYSERVFDGLCPFAVGSELELFSHYLPEDRITFSGNDDSRGNANGSDDR
jgi:hypothetical protein